MPLNLEVFLDLSVTVTDVTEETQFVFGPVQKRAFHALKDELAKAWTVADFDKDAPTQVIADASPVGLGAVLMQC